MWKQVGAGGTLVALLLGGALLLGYSPSACGCIPPALNLAFMAGMGVPGNPVVMSAEKNECGLNHELRGTKIVFGEFPYTHEDGCTQKSDSLIVCMVPEEESPLLKKGFRFTVHSQSGLFKGASVARSRWL